MRVLDPSHSGNTPTGNHSLAGCRLEIREMVKDSKLRLSGNRLGIGLHGFTEAPLTLLIVNTHLFECAPDSMDDLVVCLRVIQL